jgi:hypothetical protein
MLDVLLKVFNPVIGWLFGSPARIKIFLVVVGVLLFGGTVWYLTDKYNDQKLENAKLLSKNEQFDLQNKQLVGQVEHLEKQTELDRLIIDEQQNAINQINLEFDTLRRQKENDLNVFKKEKGRFDRLLQVKGDRIVKLANVGTERMRQRLQKATSDDHEVPN